MRGVIKKWGNSASVRIPASILAGTRLAIDTPVNVREENGNILIEPLVGHNLNDLISEITQDNLHQEIDYGLPVGREVL